MSKKISTKGIEEARGNVFFTLRVSFHILYSGVMSAKLNVKENNHHCCQITNFITFAVVKYHIY